MRYYYIKSVNNETVRLSIINNEKIRFEKMEGNVAYETIIVDKTHLIALVGGLCHFLVENKMC